jgi:hypothetical protein
MDRAKTRTNVEINVYGDAVNSTIIGIAQGSRSIRTDDSLFRKVLFEYLGLATLREVAARIDLHRAAGRNQIREFDFSRDSSLLRLWQAVLQNRYGFATPSTFMLDAYDARGRTRPIDEWQRAEQPLFPGTWVRLRNLQLSSFVNRAPGKFFLGGWRFTYGHEAQEQDRFTVSERMWTWEDYAVRTLGIGDVRLGPLDGFVVLQVGCPNSSATSATSAGGAALSPLGFPVLVEDLLYKKLKPVLDVYGAAYLEELTAQLVPAPEETGLVWAPGVPKTCLVAIDRAGMSTPHVPAEAFNSIWTVAANADRSRFHYCVWGFENGVKNHRANIKNAVETIAAAMAERQLHAMFECDIEQNWFSEETEFGPNQIRALSKQINRHERLRREISLNDIDACAEHTIADALEGRSVDPNSMERLSRAYRLLQIGAVEESLAATEAFLKDHREHPFALYLKAANFYCLSKRPEARALLQALLKDRLASNLRNMAEHILQLLNDKDS